MKSYIFKNLAAMTLMVAGLTLLSGTAGAQQPQYPPPSQPTATIKSVKAKPLVGNANDSASGQVTILADMNLKADTLVVRPGGCFWTPGGFWNSGNSLAGSRSFWDPVPAKLCPSKRSPTGLVKVAGGTSGRNCGNVASAKRPAFPIIRGRVFMVANFNVKIPVEVTAVVQVKAWCGFAKASAKARINVTVRQYVRAKGNASASIYGSVAYKASANASVFLSCVEKPPKPTPPVPPPAKFNIFVGKVVLAADGRTNVSAKYTDRDLQLTVQVWQGISFPTWIKMRGSLYTMSADGRTAFQVPTGTWVRVCERLSDVTGLGLVTAPASPFTPKVVVVPVDSSTGCLPYRQVTANTTFWLFNQEVPPVIPPPPIIPPPPSGGKGDANPPQPTPSGVVDGTPGPDPANTSDSPSGTTPSGGTPGGGQATCPPPLKPAPAGDGCVP